MSIPEDTIYFEPRTKRNGFKSFRDSFSLWASTHNIVGSCEASNGEKKSVISPIKAEHLHIIAVTKEAMF